MAARNGEVFPKDSYVFIPHDEHGFVPAKVLANFKRGKKGAVELRWPRRNRVQVSEKESKLIVRTDEKSLRSTHNMEDVGDLSEAAILHNLRTRFSRDNVYTNLGSTLVSVNPYKVLPLYTPETMEEYMKTSGNNVPPHVYTLADKSFWSMIESGQSQYCVVTGESGSGKTEVVKVFLQYVTEISKGKEEAAKARLQQRILASGPVLEAFGNAVTEANSNSSRFGKAIAVAFHNRKGTLASASIQNYLLEKTRIVLQSPTDRNFHVFYGLCSAAQLDLELNESLQLQEADQYHYLNQHDPALAQAQTNDLRAFEDMVAAFDMFEVSHQVKSDIYCTLAGILHLGNINFIRTPSNGETAVDEASRPELEICAYLFGMSSSALANGLCAGTVGIVGDGPQRAVQARDGFAKAIYSNLFDWIVRTINASMQPEEEQNDVNSEASSLSHISILDIFGFEDFANNSFEQLCINYCNEKIQLHFNTVVFAEELEMYEKNGVDVTGVDFVDNSICIQLFEHPTLGILHSIDTESKSTAGTDAGALSKVVKSATQFAKETGNSLLSAQGKSEFEVSHYPGTVRYNIRGFVMKNRDVLNDEIELLCVSSSNALLATLFFEKHSMTVKEQGKHSVNHSSNPSGAPPHGRRLSSRLSMLKSRISKSSRASSRASHTSVQSTGASLMNAATLSQRFQSQLQQLMNSWEGCRSQFIRCIKPNSSGSGTEFDSSVVMPQIRYSGLLDVCHLRQKGFPIRQSFDEFVKRYQVLAPDSRDVQVLCDALVKKGLLQPGQWQAGYSQVFMKHPCFDAMELARNGVVGGSSRHIQQVVRGQIARKQFMEYQTVVANLEAAMQTRDVDSLHQALLDAEDLPGEGDHIEVVTKAKSMLQDLSHVVAAEEEIEEALHKMDTGALKHALSSVKVSRASIHSAVNPTLVSKAEQALVQLADSKEIVEALNEAMMVHDLNALNAALERAEGVGMSPSKIPEYRHAIAMQVRIEDESKLIRQMESLLSKSDMKEVGRCLEKMADFGGLEEHPVFVRAERIWTESKRQVANSRSRAMTEDSSATVKRVSKAKANRKQIIQETLKVLEQATERNDIARLQEARVNVIKYNMKGDIVDKAMSCYKRLNRENENVLELISAIDVANAASQSRRGMRAADIEELAGQISVYKARNLTHTNAEFQQAVSLESKLRAQFKVQKALEGALKSDNVRHVKDAIAKANDLELDLELLDQVKDWLRKLQTRDKSSSGKDMMTGTGAEFAPQGRMTRFATAIGIELRKVDDEDYDAERQRNLREARNPRYNLSNYPNIRTDSDYTKGIGGLFSSNKRQEVAKNKLRYQDTPIPRSLTILDSAASNHAIVVHKAILGYCGDRMMAFPVVLGQRVMDDGIVHPELADEIYLQLCKQITGNEKRNSCTRAWQLMSMAVACFSPSSELEMHLMNFLLQAAERYGSDLLGGYAQYALRRLESSLIRGADRIVPTVEQIVAFQDRPPVLAKIELADGSVLAEDLPVDPVMQVSEVLKICRRYLGLTDPRADSFGIFFSSQGTAAAPGREDKRRKTLKRGEVSARHAPPRPRVPSVRSGSQNQGSQRSQPPTPSPQGSQRSQPPTPNHSSRSVQSGSTSSGVGNSSSGSLHTPKPPPLPPVFEPQAPPPKSGRSARANKAFAKMQQQSSAYARNTPAPPTTARVRPRPPPPREPEEKLAPTPLAKNEFIGDIVKKIVRRRAGDVPVFVFRRMTSYPPAKEDPKSDDPMYSRILYLEAADEVINGHWPVPQEQLLAKLTAISMAVDLGNFPASPQALLFSKLGEYIPQTWSKKKNAMGWAKVVFQFESYVRGKSVEELQDEYVSLCRKLPNFGMIFFAVKKQPVANGTNTAGDQDLVPLMCGINWVGLTLTSPDKERVLEVIPHSRISRISATSTQLLLHVQKSSRTKKEPKVVSLRTLQAEAICSLLLDYTQEKE